MSPSADAMPTRNLVVKTDWRADACYYDVFSGPGQDAVKLRTFRFSELCALHKSIVLELRTCFPPRLPRRTLRRIKDPKSIETRRRDIEVYLRLGSATVGHSVAFKRFFESASELHSKAPPLDEKETLTGEESAALDKNSGSTDDKDNDEGVLLASIASEWTSGINRLITEQNEIDASVEDEDEIVGRSFNRELLELLEHKHGVVQTVTSTVRDWEEQLAIGEHALETRRSEANAAASLAKQAASVLNTHQSALKGLKALMDKNDGVQACTKSEKRKVAMRLDEEVASAKAATQKSRARYEAARQSVLDNDAASSSKLATLEQAVVDAEVRLAAVVEQKASITSSVSVLQRRVESASAASAAVQRERDALADAVRLLAADSAGAEAAFKEAEENHNICVAECVDHAEQEATRTRKINLVVHRAKERSVLADRIRDLRSRSKIGGEDRDVIEEAESRAISEASVAAEALKCALETCSETLSADVVERVRLDKSCEKAANNLENRRSIASALRARMAGGQVALRQAEASFASAKAVERSALSELELLQKRMGDVAATLEEDCATIPTILASTRAAVRDAKRQAEHEQAELKHAEEAEYAVLRRHEAEAAFLVQSFNEAQLTVFEIDDYFADNVHLLKRLIEDEMVAVEALIVHHEEADKRTSADADKDAAAWAVEKETIKANLHRADLQAARAQTDLEAAQSLRKSFMLATNL
eukprot:TRINITY_DN932_c0_g1_i5.p1 TRINITY_DN932_c0_g1~~TRINITY_DN932_c0_g1_i5.p1  ORF type:complete len:718 (-),score=138.11 TRINITY_DN932_c0_g1_i5:258-2390(-)